MKGERSWHIETFRARWLPLCSWRQEQHLQPQSQLMTGGTKNSCNSSCIFANHFKKMVIGTWHMNWFLAPLGLPRLSNCACPELVIFVYGSQWFLLECITSNFFFLDFLVALPKWLDLGNTSKNPLPIIFWWCWCRLSMAASPSQPAEISFPLIYHLLLNTTTLLLPYCTFLSPYHTFLLVYHRSC